MTLGAHRARALAHLFFCLLVAAPGVAAAQARTVLVLPWSLQDGDPATLAARAEDVVGVISTGEVSAIAVADARTRFEEHGSAEPPTMSDSDLDRWLALSRQAVRHLARADYALAAQTLREAQALSEPAAAELNREETRARQVLDTCLYDVRQLVETNDPRAETRALECRRLVPRIAPSPYQHTPEVVELMTRIDRRLAEAPPGSLRLESVPSGCRVRLNGIPLGETPFISEDLATGEYRAQIECGAEGEEPTHRGRIHRIRLSEGTSTVRIDVRFDSSVRTDTALRLVYATQQEADAHRLEDAITAASTIGAAEVWLLGLDAGADPASADVVRIDRVNVATSSVLASVRAHAGSGLAGAVAAVGRGANEDRTGAAPVAMPLWGARPEEEASVSAGPSTHASSGAPRADWELGVGAALGALGVGAYVTSFVLLPTETGYGHLATQALPTDPDYLTRRSNWTSWELPVLALGWTGGALVTAALPFVMGNESSTPWWSWVIGGVGLATVGAGVAVALTASTCGSNGQPTDACVQGTALADTGSSIASLGVPLLSVPIVFLIRDAIGGGAAPVTPSASVSATGASLSLGGTW